MNVELGLDTFGDIANGPDGQPLHPAVVIREVLAEGELADRLGLDFFGVGEHHRRDYAISAPDTVLAALAARTERIRLGTSVTVLSSDDPIRVFQRFSTVDAISRGRAEITVGRGSFIESFPLFGLDLGDYETLFDEKLSLLAAVVAEQPVTWEGTIRPPVDVDFVQPATESGHLPVWVGVGGTPQSVVRAAHYELPRRHRHHRWLGAAVRTPRRPLPPRARRTGQGARPVGVALARLRRGHGRAGPGGVPAALGGVHEQARCVSVAGLR